MCGKNVTEDGWHVFACLTKTGRLSRHSNLNALTEQSLSSSHIPSVSEPGYLYRIGQMRPDVLTFVLRAVGK